MPLGGAQADFTLDAAAPVETIRVIAGPSRPRAALREGAIAWRLLSLLSLNYLSLLDNDAEKGAPALRELLRSYAHGAERGAQRQIEGVRSVRCGRWCAAMPIRARSLSGAASRSA